MRLNLILAPDRYSICRLAADADIPEWACRVAFLADASAALASAGFGFRES